MTTTLLNPEQRRRVVAARTKLIIDEPFFGVLSMRLILKEDPSHPTAWVDGQSLGYNPEFVARCKHDELIGLLKHEVMHCAAGHPWRRGARDPEKANEAMDRAINPVLRDSGVVLPKGALYELEPSHKGKSFEWIYDRLPKPQQQPQSGGGQGKDDQGADDQGSDQSAQGQGKGQPDKDGKRPPKDGAGNGPGRPQDKSKAGGQPDTSSRPQSSGPGQGEKNASARTGPEEDKPHKSDVLGEVRDAPKDADPADGTPPPTEEDWRQAVQQAAQVAKGQGKLPGEFKRFVKDAAKSRIDWRSALRRFVQEVARADYTFTRPNVRYVTSGLYLPALRNHEVGDLAIGVDTSGSIDSVLLAQFEAEIRAIADEVKPRKVRVLYCDAKVHSEETFERDDIIKLRPCGGGGTDFRPVFDTIAKWEEPPVAVVYLTDLMGTFPKQDPGIPTLWVTGDDRTKYPLPFGELVAAA